MTEDPKHTAARKFMIRLARGGTKMVPFAGQLIDEAVFGTMDDVSAAKEQAKLHKILENIEREVEAQNGTVIDVLEQVSQQTDLSNQTSDKINQLIAALTNDQLLSAPQQMEEAIERFLSVVERAEKSLTFSPIRAAPNFTAWRGRSDSLGEAFFGREAQVDALGEDLDQHKGVILSGGAGTGKSRLVSEYTHSRNARGFWTAAGETVDRTLAALAPFLGVQLEKRSDEEVAEEVQQTLPTLPDGALWVIDNLIDVAFVNALANAAGPLKLLVTTRDARRGLVPPNFAFHEVHILDTEASVALLCSRSDCQPDDPQLPNIAEIVGYLPLALEMLAVRLDESLQTPKKILEELRKAPTPIEIEAFMDAAGATVERPEGVFATITGILASFNGDDRRSLEPLGYLADAPAPLPLIAVLTDLDEQSLGRLLEKCRRQSVLSLADGSLVVHALTMAAIATTNPQESFAEAMARYKRRLNSISQDDPVALRDELTHHETMHLLATETLGGEDPTVLSYVSDLANSYYTLGRYEEGVGLYEGLLRRYEQVLGQGDPDTLRCRHNLGSGYFHLERYEEAMAVYEETLKVREQVLRPEDPETLSSRIGLANCYGALGRNEEAVALHEELLRNYEQVQAADGPDTSTNRNALGNRINLALSYHRVGRNEEAMALDEATLRIYERALGPKDPDTLLCRHNLAIGYAKLGRIEEAVALHEETLKVREQVLGPEHPNTQKSRNSLAGKYSDLGRQEEAIALYEEILRIYERVLGPEHPNTLNSRTDLAIDYANSERNQEALTLFEENLQVRMQVLGPKDPETLDSLDKVAGGTLNVGRIEEAVTLFEQTLKIRGEVLGSEHPDTLDSLNTLAAIYRGMDRDREADELENRIGSG